ncbi:hypothetical protein Leryth_014028 [Lithospermum erythrorhizon]|nr:hypothetical protein Leryth_014028 [Lithospermum erythrorhizon]
MNKEMDLGKETEDYIRESIEYSVGLPVSTNTLRLKLHAVEESNRRLRDQNLFLQSKLIEKDQTLDRFKAESSMNAQALKRFVEENQRLAEECRDLLEQCKKWEGECALYERDREALMDFSNEADERATDAEQKLGELKEEVQKLEEKLQYYKTQCDAKSVDATGNSTYKEQQLVESFFPAIIDKVDAASTARALVEANGGIEDCQSLVTKLNGLSPYALKVLALVAKVKLLQKAKDILRNNLVTAEEEVEALFQENKTLDAENKRIMLESVREKRITGSGGCRSRSASSTKGNKRKSSTKLSSDRPVEKKLDYGDEDSLRFPLLPLQFNSPECKLDK